MKRYNATSEQAAHRTTHQSLEAGDGRCKMGESRPAGKTLDALAALNMPDGDGRRLTDRTKSKGHFRAPVGMAALMGAETFEHSGIAVTEPPTELTSVHRMLTGLHEYVEGRPVDMAAPDIVDGLKRALGMVPDNVRQPPSREIPSKFDTPQDLAPTGTEG